MKRVSFMFRVERAAQRVSVPLGGCDNAPAANQRTCHVHLVGAKHKHDSDKQISTNVHIRETHA